MRYLQHKLVINEVFCATRCPSIHWRIPQWKQEKIHSYHVPEDIDEITQFITSSICRQRSVTSTARGWRPSSVVGRAYPLFLCFPFNFPISTCKRGRKPSRGCFVCPLMTIFYFYTGVHLILLLTDCENYWILNRWLKYLNLFLLFRIILILISQHRLPLYCSKSSLFMSTNWIT